MFFVIFFVVVFLFFVVIFLFFVVVFVNFVHKGTVGFLFVNVGLLCVTIFDVYAIYQETVFFVFF